MLSRAPGGTGVVCALIQSAFPAGRLVVHVVCRTCAGFGIFDPPRLQLSADFGAGPDADCLPCESTGNECLK
jgi:hypothetical protein